MSDELEVKVWKLEGDLAVESGAELMEKLESLEVGEDVLAVGMEAFTFDDDGEMEKDVPAEQIAKRYFRAKYEGELTPNDRKAVDNGTNKFVVTQVNIGDHHKDMVKQICETGEYVPPLPKAAKLSDKLAKSKRLKGKPKVKDVKVEKVPAGK